MNKLRWYFKRLKVMRPLEIVHRVKEFSYVYYLYLSYIFGLYPSKNNTKNSYQFFSDLESQLPQLSFDYNVDSASIENSLAGEIRALAYKWRWQDDSDCWFQAPDTGNYWPKIFFNKIDYREGNQYGDLRVAWEPSRLQQLVEYSLIARGRPKFRDRAISMMLSQLKSWIRENPPACGIHYISSMECSLRILSICTAFDISRDYLVNQQEVWRDAADLIEIHADFISKRLSLHSSCGNHTIAECAGLVYAGVLFPKMKDSKRWLETGISILSEEAERQILSDGGGIERSTWYHLFVLDLLGLVEQLLIFKKLPVPNEITDALSRGRKFISAIADSPENLPKLGDADGGFALSPYLRLSWEKQAETRLSFTFQNYGITVVQLGQKKEGHLIFDHGSLGMRPSFGHGHSDALSITLKLDGQDVLIDPGTFTYTGDTKWRKYFRSTRAHNTVCIDDIDQAQQETSFLWSRPYDSSLVKKEELHDGTILLLAKHNGYERLGVTHWRGLVIDPKCMVIVWDYIEGNENHKFELNWHLSNNPSLDGTNFRVTTNKRIVQLSITGGDLKTCSGEIGPLLGWSSSQYGQKEPITTIQAYSQNKATLPFEFITKIEFDNSLVTNLSTESLIEKMKSWVYETKTN